MQESSKARISRKKNENAHEKLRHDCWKLAIWANCHAVLHDMSTLKKVSITSMTRAFTRIIAKTQRFISDNNPVKSESIYTIFAFFNQECIPQIRSKRKAYLNVF